MVLRDTCIVLVLDPENSRDCLAPNVRPDWNLEEKKNPIVEKYPITNPRRKIKKTTNKKNATEETKNDEEVGNVCQLESKNEVS